MTAKGMSTDGVESTDSMIAGSMKHLESESS